MYLGKIVDQDHIFTFVTQSFPCRLPLGSGALSHVIWSWILEQTLRDRGAPGSEPNYGKPLWTRCRMCSANEAESVWISVHRHRNMRCRVSCRRRLSVRASVGICKCTTGVGRCGCAYLPKQQGPFESNTLWICLHKYLQFIDAGSNTLVFCSSITPGFLHRYTSNFI